MKALNIENACMVYSVEYVSKIVSILSIAIYAIYAALCFQPSTYSCYDCENICTLSYYEIRNTNH